jgi:predicted N-formylglutamate amidohydrolase
LPEALGTLGLPESELKRHIAQDLGAEHVARRLSRLLDAPLVLQRYSRLA